VTVIVADPGRAINYPIIIEQRSRFDAVFSVQNEDGTAMDLTGFSADMQIRPYVESDTVYVSLASGAGITLGGTAGTVTVEIPGTETELFAWRLARYDLYIVDGTGDPQRIFEGEVTVIPTVTRD
jgi:hypothetical protein